MEKQIINNIDAEDTEVLSTILESIMKRPMRAEISMQEIKEFFHARGFAIMLVLSAVPAVIPMPPGFSFGPGLLIVLFSMQMLLGYKSPWLPKWLAHKTISHTLLVTLINKLLPYLRRSERIMRPRFTFICTGKIQQFMALLCLLAGLAVFLPIPFSNAIPSLGVLLIGLGLMMRDGLTTLAGAVVSVIGLTIAVIVIWISIGAIKMVVFNFFGLGTA